MSEGKRERGLLFPFAGQMKELGEKAKGISLSSSAGGQGGGRGLPPPGPLPSIGQARAHKDSGGCCCSTTTVCLPLLSLRPHDSTSLHNIMAVQLYHQHYSWRYQICSKIGGKAVSTGIRDGQFLMKCHFSPRLETLLKQIKYLRTELPDNFYCKAYDKVS